MEARRHEPEAIELNDAEVAVAATFERLVRIAVGQGVPAQDCEDLAQEVIFQALRQMREGRFRKESRLETWLIGILHHKITDYWRRRNSLLSSTSALEVQGLAPSEAQLSQPGFQRDPIVLILVGEALRALSPRKRLILILNKHEGWTIEEIAERFGWKPGSVGVWLAEARHEFCDFILESRNTGGKTLRR